MAINSYQGFATFLVPVIGGQWNAVTIPVGAIDAVITLQDTTLSFRVASVDGGAATAGAYVPAQGSYALDGTCAKETNIFVYPSGGTNAVLQIQT